MTDVATATAALATCLGVSGLDGGVTPQGMSALVTVLGEYKAFATDTDNSARTVEVVRVQAGRERPEGRNVGRRES